MSFRFPIRWCVAALSVAIAACGSDAVGPRPLIHRPASTPSVRSLDRRRSARSSRVAVVVQVSDAKGRPVINQAVALAVTAGNGSTDPRVAITDAKGQATATWTAGTILGPNEVTASVAGVTTQVKFQATGTSGPVKTISISPQNPRLLSGVDSTRSPSQSLDSFGNMTTPAPTLVARDPSLITVASNGVVRVLRRGAATYVVAHAGEKTDSVLVTVLATGQSLCTGVATPVDLAVGQVITDVSGTGFCVHASSPGTEYAIIPFYNSGVPSATLTVEVRGLGLSPLTVPNADVVLSRKCPGAFVARSNVDARPRLRAAPPQARARRGQPALCRRARRLAESACFAGASRALQSASSAAAAATTRARGRRSDEAQRQHVNYCDQPDYRTGRVMAITDRAIVARRHGEPGRRLHRRRVPDRSA